VIIWGEGCSFKTPAEVFKDCARSADNHSIGSSTSAQQQKIRWQLGSWLIDSKCLMRQLNIQGN